MFDLRAKFCFSIVLIFTMLFASCDKSISNPVTGEEIPIIWCKDLSDAFGAISASVNFPYYNSTVVFGSTRNNLGALVGLDIETGEQKWEYLNINIAHTSQSQVVTHNQYYFENKAYFLDDPYNHYFVDITSGEIEKIVSEEQCFRDQFGIGNSVFSISKVIDSDGFFYFCVIENDLSNPNTFEQLLCPNYDFEHATHINSFGYLEDLHLFESSGDILMLIGFRDADEGEFELSSFWGVYNLTSKEWEVEKEPIFHDFEGRITSVEEHNGLYYFTGTDLKCIDRTTKELQWSQPVNGRSTLIKDHEIILVNASVKGEINAFDVQTGAELWSYPKASKSPIHYQDDILYFIGIENDILTAINIQDGSEVWNIGSPDNSIWLWQINGIPAQNGEKGKIFASSYLTGYCFEAVN